MRSFWPRTSNLAAVSLRSSFKTCADQKQRENEIKEKKKKRRWARTGVTSRKSSQYWSQSIDTKKPSRPRGTQNIQFIFFPPWQHNRHVISALGVCFMIFLYFAPAPEEWWWYDQIVRINWRETVFTRSVLSVPVSIEPPLTLMFDQSVLYLIFHWFRSQISKNDGIFVWFVLISAAFIRPPEVDKNLKLNQLIVRTLVCDSRLIPNFYLDFLAR